MRNEEATKRLRNIPTFVWALARPLAACEIYTPAMQSTFGGAQGKIHENLIFLEHLCMRTRVLHYSCITRLWTACTRLILRRLAARHFC
jgi:hypothetical protein